MQSLDSVKVYAGLSEDGRVMLRWAPPGVDGFYAADSLGYEVVRRGPGDTAWTQVAGSPIFRYEDQRLYRLGDSVDGVAAFFMSTRPDSFIRRETFGLAGALEAREQLESLVGFAVAATLTDRRAAAAAGMYLEEDVPNPGAYVYRVRVAGGAGFAPGYAFVDTRGSATPLPRVDQVGAAWADREVTLTWDEAPEGYPALYHVYRSVGGAVPERVNPRPLFADPEQRMSFPDSLADNETMVSYTIRAVDYFGRLGPVSPIANGRGVPPISFAAPTIAKPTELPGGHVRIAWRYGFGSDTAAIAEQRVFRALRDAGPFQQLPVRLGGEARVVIDSVSVAEQQYYHVEAYDEYGRMRRSATAYYLAIDTVPPPPPTGLQAVAYPTGEVAVGWLPVDDPGLLGYRVFFSNSRARPGQRLSPKHETVNLFRDTLSLASLGDSVYYRVVSLDLRDNVSDFSAPVAVALPDVRAPEPARLLTAAGDTAGIRIDYVPSVALDVAREQWRRRAAGTTDWRPFATRAAVPLARDSNGVVVAGFAEAHLTDSTAGDAYGYEYQLAVFDEAGLRSLSNVVPGKRKRAPYVQGVEGLSAKPQDDGRAVVLQWRYSGPGVARYVIYRAPGADAPLQTYRELDPMTLDFKGPNRRDGSMLYRWRDEDAAYGQAYRYEVVAVAGDERVSRGAVVEFNW